MSLRKKIWNSLVGRSSSSGWESLPAGSPLREPESVGPGGLLPPITPWSAARLAAIFQQGEPHRSGAYWQPCTEIR